MRTITIVNSKGGSGKSTLATNLASYFACWGIRVTLVDTDPQASALDWLQVRPTDRPGIKGIAGREGAIRVPPGTDYAIVDVPSGTQGQALNELLRKSDIIVVPVLPSPMDIRATGKFIFELLQDDEISRRQVKVCVVANRVRENTRIYKTLEKFLSRVGIPFIAKFRDSQNYIRTAERGIGIFELPPRTVLPDLAQWQPLISWIFSEPGLPIIPPAGGESTPATPLDPHVRPSAASGR